jgi:hypothetical protein
MGFHQKQWISCQSNEGFNHPTFGAVQLKSMEFFTNKTGDDNHLCRGKKNMVDIPILWGWSSIRLYRDQY